MRLFVALELPPEAVAELLRAREEAVAADAGWRGVAQAALHVTLVFLGSRPEQDVDAVAAAVGVVVGDRPAPPLRLGHAIGLPRRRPHALALEVEDPSGALAGLQADVAAALAAAGVYEPEGRAWRPHATIARARPRARPAVPSLDAGARAEFLAPAVTLFESRTLPEGAAYQPLARRILR